MPTLRPMSSVARPRRGAALLMSLLVLFILIALVFQISVTAQTDARTARNEVNLRIMDDACESALLQLYDTLSIDADAGGAGAAPGAAGDPAAAGGEGAGGAGGMNPDPAAAGGQQTEPVDSRRDEWAAPQRTEINEVKLRIFVQDEDSKYNVLNLLNPDEKLAEAALNRVIRILDKCREGTSADIEESKAVEMGRAMLEYMTKRQSSNFPRPKLLTDIEDNEDRVLPLSLREFMVLPGFDESLYRDFRDDEGKVVHTIESFLTTWSSLQSKAELDSERAAAAPAPAAGRNTGNRQTPQQPAPGQSGSGGAAPPAEGKNADGSERLSASETDGYAVNINTAPAAVLKSLFDDRELHPRFWDKVIEHRNLEEEEEEGEEEQNPEDAPLDEYGRPILKRRIFEQPSEVQELDGWESMTPSVQDQVMQLCSTQSYVFTIYILARRSTAQDGGVSEVPESAEEQRAEEERGDSLVRIVRSVVWRTKRGEETVIVPLVRWEVLDFLPHEVLDYPDEER